MPHTKHTAVIAHRGVVLAYRFVALVLILTGLARITGILSPDPQWNSLLYYTVQSNVLCLVWVLVLTWATARDLVRRGVRGFSVPSARVSGAVMMAITVTMCVYLFVPKGSFRAADPLLWALIPLAYLVFALVFGGLGGEFAPGQSYPYPFLDVATLGAAGVAAWVAGLTVALIGVGYVFVAIDRLAAGRAGSGRAAS